MLPVFLLAFPSFAESEKRLSLENFSVATFAQHMHFRLTQYCCDSLDFLEIAFHSWRHAQIVKLVVIPGLWVKELFIDEQKKSPM